MILPYMRFRNTSGKVLQQELRLSESFSFGIGEVVQIAHPQQAEYNDGFKDGFIVNCIEYRGEYDCYYTAWISEKFLSDNFTLEPYPTFKNQQEMFWWIWNDRKHVSQLSHKVLKHKNDMRWHAQFLHILPKGSYPKWKLNPYNILLALPEEHDIQERFPYFLELRQKLTLLYHQTYYKR